MYCYTYVNQFTCIFNELQLWTHISSDHPTFFKTVAALSKIKLPKATEEQLDEFHRQFNELHNNVLELKKRVGNNPNLYRQHIAAVRRAIDEFLLLDRKVVAFYPQLLSFGTENKAWQELVKHITDEQRFMLELVSDLRKQVYPVMREDEDEDEYRQHNHGHHNQYYGHYDYPYYHPYHHHYHPYYNEYHNYYPYLPYFYYY